MVNNPRIYRFLKTSGWILNDNLCYVAQFNHPCAAMNRILERIENCSASLGPGSENRVGREAMARTTLEIAWDEGALATTRLAARTTNEDAARLAGDVSQADCLCPGYLKLP
jgi:hypothetical protein